SDSTMRYKEELEVRECVSFLERHFVQSELLVSPNSSSVGVQCNQPIDSTSVCFEVSTSTGFISTFAAFADASAQVFQEVRGTGLLIEEKVFVTPFD
ncbi:hypothetical protein BOX15_Mlig003131g1, partial [Macrostomum lignano]